MTATFATFYFSNSKRQRQSPPSSSHIVKNMTEM